MREKYRRLAQEKGVKNPEVAKKSGIPYSTLVDWLNGRTKKLSLETCAKLASYFDVPVSYFAGDSNEREQFYVDDEVAQMAKEIYNNTDLYEMFMKLRNLSKEDRELVKQLLHKF